MSEQVRMATRELRWEQIQAAITDLLAEGTTPISMMEIARRCDIPRSTLSKEAEWKAAISAAEAERVRRRTEHLQQLRVGFLTPLATLEGDAEPGDRKVTLEGIVQDLRTLLALAGTDSTAAYERGREEAMAELQPAAPEDLEARLARAFEEGRQTGRNEFSEDLNQAYERGLKDGREVAVDAQSGSVSEAYERGLADGRAQGGNAQEAYERGLAEGRAQIGDLHEAYERGRQDGHTAASAEAKSAYDRGRQMGRAELQVELKQAFEQGYKEGKAEAASDVMNAYDRGRRDGWEEGRRDQANGRSMFGFTVNKGPNPDKEWALALMHATPSATPDQLRATYRMLTKAYHPDRNPDIPPEFIRNLNRAKEILGF